jgi:hypothetical protein
MPERRSTLLRLLFGGMLIPVCCGPIAIRTTPASCHRIHPSMASTGRSVPGHAGRLDEKWAGQKGSAAWATSVACGRIMSKRAGMTHVNRKMSPLAFQQPRAQQKQCQQSSPRSPKVNQQSHNIQYLSLIISLPVLGWGSKVKKIPLFREKRFSIHEECISYSKP